MLGTPSAGDTVTTKGAPIPILGCLSAPGKELRWIRIPPAPSQHPLPQQSLGLGWGGPSSFPPTPSVSAVGFRHRPAQPSPEST